MIEDVGILVFKERVVVHRSAYQKVGARREDIGKKQACIKFAMAPCEWYRELNLVLFCFLHLANAFYYIYNGHIIQGITPAVSSKSSDTITEMFQYRETFNTTAPYCWM